MDRIIWDAEEIRKEIRRLDRITDLNGVQLPIHFHKRGRAVGKFCYTETGKMHFSFNTNYFDDPTMSPEVLLDVIRHEYAHYMDYVDRGTTGHGKPWKQCCLVVGAMPVRYFNVERAWRINDQHLQERKRNELFDTCAAGMRIDHPRFGAGAVACIRGVGLNRIADVVFDDGGQRSLGLGWVCDHCPLQTAEKEICA